MRAKRQTVDLAGYPDLVVIYLGMRAESLRGVFTLLRTGPAIQKAADEAPDGLLLHETVFYGFFPLHVGMRQYWRDFESLEKWTRAMPHKEWWRSFLADAKGTSFWHEAYFAKGGMEAIYLDLGTRIGFAKFAPLSEARGSLFSARRRVERQGDAPAPAVSEQDHYGR